MLEYIPLRLGYIPLRLEYIPLRLEYIPLRLGYIPLRLEYIPLRLGYIPLRLGYARLVLCYTFDGSIFCHSPTCHDCHGSCHGSHHGSHHGLYHGSCRGCRSSHHGLYPMFSPKEEDSSTLYADSRNREKDFDHVSFCGSTSCGCSGSHSRGSCCGFLPTSDDQQSLSLGEWVQHSSVVPICVWTAVMLRGVCSQHVGHYL